MKVVPVLAAVTALLIGIAESTPVKKNGQTTSDEPDDSTFPLLDAMEVANYTPPVGGSSSRPSNIGGGDSSDFGGLTLGLNTAEGTPVDRHGQTTNIDTTTSLLAGKEVASYPPPMSGRSGRPLSIGGGQESDTPNLSLGLGGADSLPPRRHGPVQSQAPLRPEMEAEDFTLSMAPSYRPSSQESDLPNLTLGLNVDKHGQTGNVYPGDSTAPLLAGKEVRSYAPSGRPPSQESELPTLTLGLPVDTHGPTTDVYPGESYAPPQSAVGVAPPQSDVGVAPPQSAVGVDRYAPPMGGSSGQLPSIAGGGQGSDLAGHTLLPGSAQNIAVHEPVPVINVDDEDDRPAPLPSRKEVTNYGSETGGPSERPSRAGEKRKRTDFAGPSSSVPVDEIHDSDTLDCQMKIEKVVAECIRYLHQQKEALFGRQSGGVAEGTQQGGIAPGSQVPNVIHSGGGVPAVGAPTVGVVPPSSVVPSGGGGPGNQPGSVAGGNQFDELVYGRHTGSVVPGNQPTGGQFPGSQPGDVHNVVDDSQRTVRRPRKKSKADKQRPN